jgi:hypothetical protein
VAVAYFKVLKGVRKTTKVLSWNPVQNLNAGHPEYKTGEIMIG